MRNDVFARAHVPIVGESFKVLQSSAMVLVQCQCPAQTPVLLIGAGNVVECQACGKSYAIVKTNGCVVGEVRPKAPLIEAHPV